MKTLNKFFDIDKQYLKKYEAIADRVIALENEYAALTDEQLVEKTNEFKQRINDGQTIEEIQVEAFATVREGAKRATGMTPFKVQIIGACALIDGNIAEMKTGEGKTLTSTLPVYTLALLQKGVHVITVNDYLAERDASEMGEIYNFLGMTVGLNLREMTVQEKQEAYNADITYTTNSELGFDYLRDNMVMTREARVQRGLIHAVVDEVDSILIDESRTPLIISGNEKKSHNMYQQVDALVKSLKEDRDFKINAKDKTALLLSNGIDLVERAFAVGNMYDVRNSQLTHAVNQSLRANFCMHLDVDYVVRDNEVVIVDQFTGRTMEGRTFSDGLHQAIEAKEHVDTQKETKTMATITYQNFFRLYEKLSGMTGTAKTEEEEFQKTYNMDVVCIPTNTPVVRKDNNDLLFVSKKVKFKYMLELIKERHNVGQPILIGTVAIESSEEIADLLQKSGIPHQVLNAKQHASEAEIIKNAGKFGAVTIATNMAGRGTDIKIDSQVRAIEPFMSEITQQEERGDGLLIVGTERHESRRIDNQLRGRSGRQGDNGESTFFVSFEDELMKRYGGDRAQKYLTKLVTDDMPISSKTLTKQVASSQKQVESINYDIRKTLLKYDDVLREQREIIYSQREFIIDSKNLIDDAKEIINRFLTNRVNYYLELDDLDGLKEFFAANVSNKEIDQTDNYLENVLGLAMDEMNRKVEEHDEDIINQYCKTVMLKVLDEAWVEHIDEMQTLRDSVGLRGYGQVDPLIEYQKDGRQMFEDMIDNTEQEIVRYLLKGRLQTKSEAQAMINKLNQEHSKSEANRKETVVVAESNKVGRNEECPCGSGKKYKNCCGK
jgi:preprotein translocase subunit SecA